MTIVALGSSEAAMLAAFDQGKVNSLSKSAPTFYVAEREYGATMLFHVSTGAVKSLDGYFQVGAAARSDWLANHEEEAIKVAQRSEEHTSELQSLMRTSYAVFCLKKKQK